MIDKAAPRLVAASAHGTDDKGDRTALDAAFGPRERDLVVAVLQERAARVSQVPIEYHEPPNAISYEPGQEFKPHVDYVDPRVPEFRSELEYLGQRTVTFVTYLNEDFEGAETQFLRANLKLRGRTGDSIVLLNVHPDGQPDYATIHCAPAPTRGRKWVLSQWIRNKPFRFRPEDLA
ncbi:MAG TPA: 2OG-Fe(II) oxygenase [Sphingomicrobium sp.]|nr:2OG-Fe(II) oxygenase [Sphingomicrobium sp.]